MDLPDLPLSAVGELLRRRTVSAVELTRAHLDRIAERDPELRAFVHQDAEAALRSARAADREMAEGLDRGPLHGVPVALKDLIDVAGVPTCYGSRLYRHHLPADDAAVVGRLASSGAVVVGKVDTYEFATVGPGFDTPFEPARNPWDPARVTGGSSSGSASAVAGGTVRASLGTDTGGSVRSPASYCGAVGLKPTYGALPLGGVFPLSPSLDHVGVIGATVGDAAVTFGAVAGVPLSTLLPGEDAARRLVVGYARDWFADDPGLDPAVLSAVDKAAAELAEAGLAVREVGLPDYQQFEDAAATLLWYESYRIHRDRLASRGGEYGVKARNALLMGKDLTADDARDAEHRAGALAQAVDDVLDTVDVIVTATTLTSAPPVDAFRGPEPAWSPMRTIAFNATGHPALSLPAGTADGAPLGVQLVGRRGGERDVLAVADLLERRGIFPAGTPPRSE